MVFRKFMFHLTIYRVLESAIDGELHYWVVFDVGYYDPWIDRRLLRDAIETRSV